MSQSRASSALESITNVVVGFALALLGQITIFPAFGLAVSLPDNLRIAVAFTMLSLMRSYLLRRLFNRWQPDRG